jgi:hypothetical protein
VKVSFFQAIETSELTRWGYFEALGQLPNPLRRVEYKGMMPKFIANQYLNIFLTTTQGFTT